MTEFVENEKGFGARTAVVPMRKPAPITPSSSGRKIYQVSADLDNEKKFMDRVNSASAFIAKKIRKKLYPCDIVLFLEKKIVGFVEFKRRTGALGYAEGVMLSLEKAAKLTPFSALTGLPIIFVIENAPGDYHAALIEVFGGYVAQIGGRKDRGDIGDQEVIILIPRAKFKPISTFLAELREENQ